MALLNDSADLYHAIGNATCTAETKTILEALLTITQHLDLLTKAVLELESGESDGKPCLTIGTRQNLQRW